MASSIEVKERQKHHLNVLLTIKKANDGNAGPTLEKAIRDAVAVMEQEDVSWIEKIVGIKAL